MEVTFYVHLEPQWNRYRARLNPPEFKLDKVKATKITQSRPENAHAVKLTLDVPTTFFMPPEVVATIEVPEADVIVPKVRVEHEEPADV